MIKTKQKRGGLLFIFDQDKTDIESAIGQANFLRQVGFYSLAFVERFRFIFNYRYKSQSRQSNSRQSGTAKMINKPLPLRDH